MPLASRPYTADQLIGLEACAEGAFHPGAVKDTVIEHIAETVAENGGDCRQALDMLLRAGRKADQEDVERVTLEHISLSKK